MPLDGPEQAEDAAGAGFAPWADMESRGDDPAAEEYWEDYLRVKMEMVSTVLQVCLARVSGQLVHAWGHMCGCMCVPACTVCLCHMFADR